MMTVINQAPYQLLVVEDDEFNRDLLHELLSNVGYDVTLAEDGEEAWRILQSGQQQFAAILLDRMMPRLDGMGLLALIKADPRFADVPVIFQTAIDQPADIAEGIKAGAFYYLVKPINTKVLFAIVQSAVSTFDLTSNLRQSANNEQANLAKMLVRVEYQVRTLPEVRTLSATLSGYYPQPKRVMLGISELLINAVEHGNLDITYAEKSLLLQQGMWESEVERRLALAENAEKKVEVKLEHTKSEMSLTIRDSGPGFDSSKYLVMSPERAFDPNGRGISMSKMMSFDQIKYLGKGNEVVALVKI